MVRKILKLRGISGEMLKTAWRGNFRRLLALNRDIMLRSLLLQLCFGAITVLGARLGSDIVAVNAVLMTLLTFTAYALDGFAYAVKEECAEGVEDIMHTLAAKMGFALRHNVIEAHGLCAACVEVEACRHPEQCQHDHSVQVKKKPR